jgi:hypothetical protein
MQVAMASSGRHFVSFIDSFGIPELQHHKQQILNWRGRHFPLGNIAILGWNDRAKHHHRRV